jgi:hypothetical protein
MRLDENSCSTQIIPPSFLALRRPLLTNTIQISSSSCSPSTEQSKEQHSRSIHLIILVRLRLIICNNLFKKNFIQILIPLLIILITLIISIIVYMRKRSSKRDLTSITPRSSSIPSISNNLDSQNE